MDLQQDEQNKEGLNIAGLESGQVSPQIRDRCYDFLNIFAEKFSEKIGFFLLKIKLNYAKSNIITLVFEKNANFFA
jgi:hypothetical protein